MNYELNKNMLSLDQMSPIENILLSRGIENPQEYLNANEDNLYDPLLLKNLALGAQLFISHVKNNSKIFLIVDCDNDGVTSAAELYLFAKEINPEINIQWMMHEGKQHGIELDKIPHNIDLLLVPDAGSNQIEEHRILASLGIDVLVLDHHIAENTENSPAIIINNQFSYPNKDLSGAGVVLKFIQYCSNLLNISSIYNYMDLAAVGIVGDMMNLKNLETRFIVNYGLSHLRNPGIKAFVKKQAFSIGKEDSLTPTDVAFFITPLINAVIRIGTQEEKELLFRAFIEGDLVEQSSKRGAKPGDIEVVGEKAARIAGNCRSRQNKSRDKSIDLIKMKIQKEELNDNKILLIALNDWESEQVNPNLTGLIAMELLAEYKKPTLVIRAADDNVYKGSARSDDCSILKNFKDYLASTGYVEYAEGHEAAFGCGIKENNLFKFLDYTNKDLENIDLNNTSYKIDFLFDAPSNYIQPLTETIEKYSSLWGRGVEEPLIGVKGIVNSKDLLVMGADRSSSKINVNGLECIKFKDKNFIDNVLNNELIEVIFIGRLKMNNFNGKSSPQLIIEHYEVKKAQLKF